MVKFIIHLAGYKGYISMLSSSMVLLVGFYNILRTSCYISPGAATVNNWKTQNKYYQWGEKIVIHEWYKILGELWLKATLFYGSLKGPIISIYALK